jgi:glycine hydroxymethyltransferase
VQGGPLMHIIAAKAVSFNEALQPEFKQYAQQILLNAKALAGHLLDSGFDLIAGGTDNHLILADVNKSFGISGAVVEEALDKIGLTLNKNTVADDPLPPFRPSGIRLGTPAITTRGMKESDMKQIADWMLTAIEAREDPAKLAELRQIVKQESLKFPLPSDSPKG